MRRKACFEPIEKTECPDPATAVVTLKTPGLEFPVQHGLG
jgi:peptide/nickel transport system substrate-binding protein